jgi:hypothetical protein
VDQVANHGRLRGPVKIFASTAIPRTFILLNSHSCPRNED